MRARLTRREAAIAVISLAVFAYLAFRLATEPDPEEEYLRALEHQRALVEADQSA